MSKKYKYLINSKKVLGSGATAKVYLGIKSDDGCQYAIKCSKDNVKDAWKMLDDEMKILKDLDNEYIIKCYESISYFRGIEYAIIMEYCNKGSLYEFTELHQGLCDNMFLKVLECLHHGIRYLREKGILHRDIKPGNMMVHQDTMGFYHVKIVDLGTAKKVGEDQQFKTICGTPEYLHPDIFIRYIGGLSSSFNANVDLWSIGVTLYHAAVTKLPFQPLKCSRSNFTYENTLKDMYLNKKPGIISGQQIGSGDGNIIWSDTLPDTCRMSPMLKGLASKLIGCLMDRSDANTYDRFYEAANKLTTKKRFLVFNSVNGELLILYVNSLTYSCVVDEISNSIGYSNEEMVILTKNKILAPLTDPNAECLRPLPIKGHLRYELTDDTVLVVVKKQLPELHPLATRPLLNTECGPPDDVYNYFTEAKNYTEVLMRSIYQIGNGANYIDCQVDCYLATMFALNQYVLVDEVRLMHEVLPWRMEALKDSCHMTEWMIDLAQEKIDNMESYSDECDQINQFRTEISSLLEKVDTHSDGIEKCNKTIVEQRKMFKYTDETFYKANDDIANDKLDFLVHLSEELVNEMKVFPEDKFDNEDDSYILEIWERHIRLYKYYQLSQSRFAKKSERVVIVHKFFYNLLQKIIKLMQTIKSWKAPYSTIEERRKMLVKGFHDFVSWWKAIESPQENTTLKSRILEIKDMMEQFKDISTTKDS